MNKLCGGKQPKMHETKMVEGCLGPEENRGINRPGGTCLQLNDIQYMVFQDEDLPPFYDQSMTKYDRLEDEMTDKEKLKRGKEIKSDKERRIKKIKEVAKKGIASLTAEVEAATPQVDETMVKRGYVGMAKGIQQVLWERGLWVEGMVMSLTDKAKSKILVAHKALPQEHLLADKVLAACPDFMEENSVGECRKDFSGRTIKLVNYRPKICS
jgi:hypothetical protein